jgi:hypothetical protein
VLLILGALFLLLTMTPMVVSLHQDNGFECSGWGGTVTWYTHEAPSYRSLLRLRRSQGMTEESDIVERDLVAPCDEVARRQAKVSLINGAGVIVVGLVAMWIVGRWPRASQPTDSDPPGSAASEWGPLPPSPPESWPDGLPPRPIDRPR